MPWWSESDNVKEGYNRDSDGTISKYHRTTSYDGDDHDHEFYNTHTGVIGYHGDRDDRSDYGKDYDNFSDNNGRYRK